MMKELKSVRQARVYEWTFTKLKLDLEHRFKKNTLNSLKEAIVHHFKIMLTVDQKFLFERIKKEI